MENQENFENSFYNLSSDGIDKSILITKKALNNINLDINKWGEIKNKNLENFLFYQKKLRKSEEKLKSTESILYSYYSEKDAETDSLLILEKQKKIIDEHGIDKVHQTIKNYCEHFDLEFQPRIQFEKVINSSAGFDGWLGYNNEIN